MRERHASVLFMLCCLALNAPSVSERSNSGEAMEEARRSGKNEWWEVALTRAARRRAEAHRAHVMHGI